MKALLLSPSAFPSLTGNAVTVDRISFQLTSHGIVCRIIDLSRKSHDQALAESLSFGPDIVHAFHAFKSGRTALEVSKALDVPLITTMTGTDLYIDLLEKEKKPFILEVLTDSRAVTVFNEDAFSVLKNADIPVNKIHVIHQSPFLPDAPVIDMRKTLGIREQSAVFLLVGALRKVKNYGMAIDVLKKAKRENPSIHLLIAGAVNEESEFQEVSRKISGEDWIAYLGEVPRTSMRSLYHSVDAVLNTSQSESENNATLEALDSGCIVIGRDITGNQSLLKDSSCILFQNEDELKKIIVHVAENRDSLEIPKAKRKNFSEMNFRFALEKKSYIELYESLM